jgi:site-specific recombinase XerD
MEAAKSPATRKAYSADLRDYLAFCSLNGLRFMPSTPEAVSLYISSLASRVPPACVSTIKRRLAAISYAHRQAGHDSPAIPRKHFVLGEVLAGIKRTLGEASHGADPLLGDAIRRIAAACPLNLLGLRDRALVLLGFAIASRRSLLASILELRDLTFTDQGLYVLIRHSKTDPFGADPRPVAVPFGEHAETCPVLAVRAWIEAGTITSGALFRAVDRHGNVSSRPLSPRSIAKILAKAVSRAGIDVASAHLSPHSLRVGMATQAAINGAEERDIARTTLHRSVGMVRRYVRDADLFRGNASGRLGL